MVWHSSKSLIPCWMGWLAYIAQYILLSIQYAQIHDINIIIPYNASYFMLLQCSKRNTHSSRKQIILFSFWKLYTYCAPKLILFQNTKMPFLTCQICIRQKMKTKRKTVHNSHSRHLRNREMNEHTIERWWWWWRWKWYDSVHGVYPVALVVRKFHI